MSEETQDRSTNLEAALQVLMNTYGMSESNSRDLLVLARKWRSVAIQCTPRTPSTGILVRDEGDKITIESWD